MVNPASAYPNGKGFSLMQFNKATSSCWLSLAALLVLCVFTTTSVIAAYKRPGSQVRGSGTASQMSWDSQTTPVDIVMFTYATTLGDENPRSFYEVNAVQSWLHLRGVNIRGVLVFVDSLKQCPTQRFGSAIKCVVSPCTHRETRLPIISCGFQHAYEYASNYNALLVYVNSDIVLLPDAFRILHTVRDNKAFKQGSYCIAARRMDVVVPDATWKLDFTSDHWVTAVYQVMSKNAAMHPDVGIDVFIYPPTRHIPLPPFLVGRWRWDNWLLARQIKMGHVIDGTEAILPVHQQSHRIEVPNHTDRRGSDINHKLAMEHGAWSFHIGYLRYTDYYVMPGSMNTISERTAVPGMQSLISQIYRHADNDGQALLVLTPSLEESRRWLGDEAEQHVPGVVFAPLSETAFSAHQRAKLPVGSTWFNSDTSIKRDSDELMQLPALWVQQLADLATQVLEYNIILTMVMLDGRRTARQDIYTLLKSPPDCDIAIGGSDDSTLFLRPMREGHLIFQSGNHSVANAPSLCSKNCPTRNYLLPVAVEVAKHVSTEYPKDIIVCTAVSSDDPNDET